MGTADLHKPVHDPSWDRSRSAYDYDLPEELIAQNPAEPRDSARLLVVDSPATHQHQRFWELPNLLRSGDLLVLNNTRVLPARLYGQKPDGAKVEILLLEQTAVDRWLALVKPGRRLKPGARIEFYSNKGNATAASSEAALLEAIVLETDTTTGGRLLQFKARSGTVLDCLHHLGQTPLPPYITHSQASPERYQTVYAERPGSAAAPTAGLHFTPNLFQQLANQGIDRAFVTLHIGVGTFRPVEVEDITNHVMHCEWAEVPPETVEKIYQTQAAGGRVIAVGTTVVRSLEAAAQSGKLLPFCDKTDLFIYPGYSWRVVQGLITNFHLPKSSLMMLVSALIGRPRLLKLYQIAIAEQYRFYSFGDAMLILPEAADF